MLLIVVFVLVDFTLGVYHFTHGGGRVSGSIELFIAVLVGTLAFRFARRRSRGEDSSAARYRRALLAVFALVVIALLILSPYHFTHHGVPSGSIELTLAVVVAAIGLLLR
jgi:hypothetical protein